MMGKRRGTAQIATASLGVCAASNRHKNLLFSQLARSLCTAGQTCLHNSSLSFAGPRECRWQGLELPVTMGGGIPNTRNYRPVVPSQHESKPRAGHRRCLVTLPSPHWPSLAEPARQGSRYGQVGGTMLAQRGRRFCACRSRCAEGWGAALCAEIIRCQCNLAARSLTWRSLTWLLAKLATARVSCLFFSCGVDRSVNGTQGQ
jgi:hypothetical protein